EFFKKLRRSVGKDLTHSVRTLVPRGLLGRCFMSGFYSPPRSSVERNVAVGMNAFPAGFFALQIGTNVRATWSRAKRCASLRLNRSPHIAAGIACCRSKLLKSTAADTAW